MIKYAFILALAVAFRQYKIPTTGTPPRARQITRMALDEKRDVLYIFGGSSEGSNYFDDLWDFDIVNTEWRKITPVSQNKPEARIAFCMFGDIDTGLIYLFGGESRLGYLNDLWAYDRDLMNWTKLTTKGVTAPAFTRFAFTTYRDSSNKLKLVVTHGETMVGNEKNVFVLDVETLTWSKYTSGGDYTKIEMDSQIVYYQGKLYLYGGRNTRDSRLYIYNFSTQLWSYIVTTNPPANRELFGVALLGDYLYCLPGWGGVVEYDERDIKRINLRTGTTEWETLEIDPVAEKEANFPRDSYGLAISGSVVYFACGWREDGILNNIVKLDLNSRPLKYQKLSEKSMNPISRTNHSMHAIGTKLYVFGGQGEEGKLNDMWSFDIQTNRWSPVNMEGVVPEPRSGYSSCTVGDRIYLFGGEGTNQLYQDFHIFDANSLEWSSVTGVDWPSARKDACMACSFPYFGIFGGTTVNGYDGDLYYIDLRYKNVTLLSTAEEDKAGPGTLAHSECWAYPSGDDVVMMVAIGETLGETPNEAIFTYSLNQQSWQKVGKTQSMSQAAAISTGNKLLIAGGEKWGFVPYLEVYTYDIASGETTVLGKLSKSFYNGGSAYLKTSMYLHGGADNTSKKFRPAIPSMNFIRLEMNEYCETGGCNWPCSPGTYLKQQGLCEFCPAGTYNDEFGASYCKKCPVGTESNRVGNSEYRQCYPCNENFYNPNEGASYCRLCPSGYTCSIGNAVPTIEFAKSEKIFSKQPSSYTEKTGDVETIISSFQATMITIGGIVIVVFFVLDQEKRWYFQKIDLYTKNHNHFIDEIMYVRARPLGGLFSVIFILIALIFVFSNVIIYERDNIQETKALVPLVTLEEEYSEFPADITVKLILENYIDNCEAQDSVCAEGISVTNFKVTGYPTKSCTQVNDICEIVWECSDCDIETGAYINYEMQQPKSYADTIIANVTTSSSIPDEFSSIEQSIKSEFDTVFRGSEMNYLYFEMTPSVFITDSDEWETDQTGYHVAATEAPLEGSVTSVYDLPETTGLRVAIQLDKSSAGLTTKRLLKQTLILLFSGILGSVFGIMSAIGGAMQFVEKNWEKYVRNTTYRTKLEKTLRHLIKHSKSHSFSNHAKEKSTNSKSKESSNSSLEPNLSHESSKAPPSYKSASSQKSLNESANHSKMLNIEDAPDLEPLNILNPTSDDEIQLSQEYQGL